MYKALSLLFVVSAVTAQTTCADITNDAGAAGCLADFSTTPYSAYEGVVTSFCGACDFPTLADLYSQAVDGDCEIQQALGFGLAVGVACADFTDCNVASTYAFGNLPQNVTIQPLFDVQQNGICGASACIVDFANATQQGQIDPDQAMCIQFRNNYFCVDRVTNADPELYCSRVLTNALAADDVKLACDAGCGTPQFTMAGVLITCHEDIDEPPTVVPVDGVRLPLSFVCSGCADEGMEEAQAMMEACPSFEEMMAAMEAQTPLECSAECKAAMEAFLEANGECLDEYLIMAIMQMMMDMDDMAMVMEAMMDMMGMDMEDMMYMDMDEAMMAAMQQLLEMFREFATDQCQVELPQSNSASTYSVLGAVLATAAALGASQL